MKWKDWAPDPRQTSRWKRVRALVRRTYPRCEVQGCDQLSEEVHHILPITDVLWGRRKAFDWDNLRAVCRGCHPAADRGEVRWRKRADRPDTPPTPPGGVAG